MSIHNMRVLEQANGNWDVRQDKTLVEKVALTARSGDYVAP